ncbi:mucin-19 [Biomphalaria glabrata]|nr:mucin-19 [Biomphalaria glabrata]
MATMTLTDLLGAGEEHFDKAIKEMTMKNLMETISSLQKEMVKEQENFNSLSGELQNIKERNSRQYKQISKDMVTSQQRLSHLMNWSMKCFAQQNASQSKEPSTLKRTNSVKGSHPAAVPAPKLTTIQRSKSLLSIKQQEDGRGPAVAALNGDGAASPHRPVIKNATVLHVTSDDSMYAKPDLNRKSVETKVVVNSISKGVSHEKLAEGDQKSVGEGDSAGGAVASVVSVRTGGGLYVKRNQPARVTTTTNISSTKILPSYHQPGQNVTQPTPVTSSSLVSQHTANVASTSVVVTPRTYVLKSSTPAVAPSSSTPFLHPLQISSANSGVSKSQTLASEPLSYKEFRALPSVKQLAKSFGSTTALNTAGTSSSSSVQGSGYRTGSTQSSVFHGNPLVRSQSSISLADSPKQTSSSHIILVKGNTTEQKPQQEQASTLVNGRPPLPHTINRTHTTSKVIQATSTSSNNGASEIEQARARLKANRASRDIKTSSLSGDSVVNANIVAPESSKTVESEISNGETQNYSSYLKKKDNAPSKTNTATPNVIQITNGVARITNQSKLSVSSEASPASSTKSAASSTSTSSYIKRLSQPPSDYSHMKSNPYSTLPASTSRSPDRVVSTAAVTIRRVKSREELQEEGRQLMNAKDSLLKQIQARRRDDYDSEGSNFLSMSKLSQSMPSLLNDVRDIVHQLFPSSSADVDVGAYSMEVSLGLQVSPSVNCRGNTNSPSVNYRGNTNSPSVNYRGNTNSASVNYRGNTNSPSVNCRGNTNSASVNCRGNTNSPSVNYRGNTNSPSVNYRGNTNSPSVNYRGNTNSPSVNYRGNTNSASVNCRGNTNSASVNYRGNTNSASVNYRGNTNSASVNCRLNTNSASVNYRGNTNSASANYRGNTNSASVNYRGNTNSASVNYRGNTNSASVNYRVNTNSASVNYRVNTNSADSGF